MHPNPTRQSLTAKRAFTLIELLVSMTVLTLLTLCVGQLVSSATAVTTGNRKRLDADGQARVVFDRLALDFGKMLKRTDVHYLFAKVPGGSDKMYFYSEAPAFYDPSTPPAQTSSVALAGYRINAAYQFERLGKRLTWDGAPGTSASGSAGAPAPGGMVFLSFPANNPVGAYAPNSDSTLPGNWPGAIGTGANNYNDGVDADYHALAEQVFRLEFCYQMQDGTYSTVPVLNPVGLINNLGDTKPPTSSNDYDSGQYSVGSRWYDHTSNCAYVCTNSSKGAAVWKLAGMQDVRAVIVAIAILDAASGKSVPVGAEVNIGTADAPHNVQPLQLDALVQAFGDAPLPVFGNNTGEIGNANTPDQPYFPPTNVAAQTQPPSQPVRLMAEAWNNKLKSLFNGGTLPINKQALGQVRIYQRYFALNTNSSASN